ncbi:MAG: bifunctional phosphoribosylaminoimidazolecarboxamide formyltransferase/IMP cyclohydrolase [Anaeroplasma sp.]
MRALISVSDKTNVVTFAKKLIENGYEIIATGGTRKLLIENNVSVINIEDVTGFPEICEGRVKTLHPKVHGALLGRRDKEDHMKQLKENGIELIDLVCVNLYPFKATISKPDVTLEMAIENIDIGGPSMLRSAAKNFASVTVVCDPADYDLIINEIELTGNTTYETRFKLSAKAYTHTAEYDMMISAFMREKAGLNEKLFIEADLVQGLRYGENPHQSAKFYKINDVSYSLANAEQIQGKELSYNNIQDANAALNIVREFGFETPFAVGLKHMNPCGAAIGVDLIDAWTKAYNADPTSIYGGIVATNQVIDKKAAKLMKYTIPQNGEDKAPLFLEVILAPDFTEEAKAEFAKRKNVRLLKYKMDKYPNNEPQYVSVNGGLLVQEQDTIIKNIDDTMTVTKRHPNQAELTDMDFAWKIVKHVKSNAIVVVKDGVTLGVGAGQMNRVGSAKIAIDEAHSKGVTDGIVLGSDGFLPFGDTVTYASKNGVTAIVQPGGSIRDEESIVAADDANMTMLFTGMRHFKH